MTKQNLITDEFLTQFGIPDDRCVEGERIFFADDMHEFEDNIAPEPVEIPAGALDC